MLMTEARWNASSQPQTPGRHPGHIAVQGSQTQGQGEGIVESGDVVDGLEVRDVDQEQQSARQTQPGAHPQSPAQVRQEKSGNGVDGGHEEVEEAGIVPPDLVSDVLDQVGSRAAGGLLFLRREEEGEVLSDGDVVLEGLVVVDIEQVILQAAEEERRQQAHHEDVSRPDEPPVLQEREDAHFGRTCQSPPLRIPPPPPAASAPRSPPLPGSPASARPPAAVRCAARPAATTACS